jgi:hypothetical protein
MNIIKKRLISKIASDEPDWKVLLYNMVDEYLRGLTEKEWNKIQEIAEKDHNDETPLMSENDYQLIKNTSLQTFKNKVREAFLKIGLDIIYESKNIMNEKGYVPEEKKDVLMFGYDSTYMLSLIDIPLMEVDLPADNKLNYLDTLGYFYFAEFLSTLPHNSNNAKKFQKEYDKYFKVK